MNSLNSSKTRRDFLIKSSALLGVAALSSPAILPGCSSIKEKTAGVTAPEDLMREHGVLRRLLHIYDNLEGKLRQGQEFPRRVLTEAADLIRRFVENYHEKLEENYVFPRFEKAGKMVDLVKILRRQHQAGRQVTAFLLSPAASASDPAGRQQVAEYIHAFSKMYRPHAAREDTVLFPALRSVVSPAEFNDLGDKFEDLEEAKFGQGGFDKIVGQVAGLEMNLGIENLSQFTPQLQA